MEMLYPFAVRSLTLQVQLQVALHSSCVRLRLSTLSYRIWLWEIKQTLTLIVIVNPIRLKQKFYKAGLKTVEVNLGKTNNTNIHKSKKIRLLLFRVFFF